MRAQLGFWIPFLLSVNLSGAELEFDFASHPVNEAPAGFRSALTGEGTPGQWKIILDAVPSAFRPLTPNAPQVTKIPVLAQLSGDITDERFPLLIYEKEVFSDFTLTTRFKNVSGAFEQMAGIAFRLQDENNYYYVRASSMGNTFRFFKLVNGQRSAPIGPEIPIPGGTWHEMSIECKGNQIRCLLNGNEIIPVLTDNTFSSGRIAYWTKSDSIAYFVDTRITYKPHESMAEALVREMKEKYEKLLGLKIIAIPKGETEPQVIASMVEQDRGTPADTAAKNVLASDSIYYGKTARSVTVTLPMHDRNGETVAAVRVIMRSFRGQTEQNAITRAMPIVKDMELRIRSSRDWLE